MTKGKLRKKQPPTKLQLLKKAAREELKKRKQQLSAVKRELRGLGIGRKHGRTTRR